MLCFGAFAGVTSAGLMFLNLCLSFMSATIKLNLKAAVVVESRLVGISWVYTKKLLVHNMKLSRHGMEIIGLPFSFDFLFVLALNRQVFVSFSFPCVQVPMSFTNFYFAPHLHKVPISVTKL